MNEFVDEVSEYSHHLGSPGPEFFGLPLQEVLSEIDKKELKAEHAELDDHVVYVFQEDYNEQDEGSVLVVP